MLELTNQSPTKGRILHFYHPTLGYDPMPCIVVNGPFNEPNTNADGDKAVFGPHANVNVFVDGANHQAFLAELRGRPDGNTFTSVPVFDALDEDKRAVARERRSTAGLGVWCEWPPRN